jgi:A/G-specific adenine glycosylase
VITSKKFQTLLLRWFDQHGRKHLPWQQNKTPYRVWISEIMLQQTQVATVIPYYERFMNIFPTLNDLANGAEDQVLHLWAGLGYYSRARNLHKAANMVMEKFAGKFPDHMEGLLELPGIGASTAGAILSIAFNQRATILDGNVKRVLARLHGITDPIDDKAVEKQLWDIAIDYTPEQRTADYTQAIMDLGATFCTRSKPQCANCPFAKNCAGYQEGIAALIPRKKKAKEIPVRTATFILFKQGNRVLLQKRPPVGIWGGLWSLPEMVGEPCLKTIQQYCRQQWKMNIKDFEALPSFRHTFSHYHLDIFPIVIELKKAPAKIMEAEQQIWYNPGKPESVGLPKPVQQLMRHL